MKQFIIKVVSLFYELIFLVIFHISTGGKMKNFSSMIFFLVLLLLTPLNAVNLSNGDLDGDGYITHADLKILAKDLNTLVATYNGDINNDNKVDKDDISAMAKLILKESGSVKGKITNEIIKDFISNVTQGNVSNSDTSKRTKTIKTIIKNIENNKENLKITKLRKKLNSSDYTSGSTDNDFSGGSSTTGNTNSSSSSSSALSELKKIFGKVDNKTIDDIEGIPPEYPKELNDYYAKLREETNSKSLKISDFNLDISYLNNERKTTTNKIDDIIRTIEGKSIDSISLSEIPDSIVLDLSFENSSTSFEDRTSLSNKYAEIPIIKSQSDFLPKSNYELKLDPNQPEEITIFEPRSKAGIPIDKDYKVVSVWPDDIPSAFVEEKYNATSDDPFVTQILNDGTKDNSFISEADKNSDKTLTRAEVFKQLFNAQSAIMILTGQSEQMGLSKDSPLVKNYMEVLEEQEPILISTGAVDQGTIEEIKNIKRQLDNAVASNNGGNNDSAMGGIFDAISGGGDIGSLTPGSSTSLNDLFNAATTGGVVGGAGGIGSAVGAATGKLSGGVGGTATSGTSIGGSAGGSATLGTDTNDLSLWEKTKQAAGTVSSAVVNQVTNISSISPMGLISNTVIGATKGGIDAYKEW